MKSVLKKISPKSNSSRRPVAFRFTEKTIEQLKALSVESGIDRTGVLEFLIDAEFDVYFEKKKPERKKKP